jgi:hypothetical protein
MHGLYTSTQHLDKTLEPLNWIRVRPSRHDEHFCECSHVMYYDSCNTSKYMTFKPHTCPLFCIFRPNNGSHLSIIKQQINFKKYLVVEIWQIEKRQETSKILPSKGFSNSFVGDPNNCFGDPQNIMWPL